MSESLNLLVLPLIPSYRKMKENSYRERERADSYLENSAIVAAAASVASVAMCVKLCSTKFIHIFELTDLSLLKL